jgi:hypothetical protein
MSATINDSASGGYLLPEAPPDGGAALQQTLQQMVVGATGLDGTLVRPRWQPTPPVQPPVTVVWASIGIVRRDADDYPVLVHDGATTFPGASGPGVDRMQRHETITVQASFYGPDADGYAAMFRDGMYVQQNSEGIEALSMKLLDVEDVQKVPELVNQQWIDRADVTIRLRHQIDRVYPVLNIDAAQVDIIANGVGTDTRTETVTVEPAP